MLVRRSIRRSTSVVTPSAAPATSQPTTAIDPAGMIASEALLQALARAAPASLEALKNVKFTDATWNGFIRQHHQKIWDTMSKTRKLLDNPELMADIGAASASFEEFEYVATQERDGPRLGVKRSGGDVEADVGWQKAKR